MWLIVGLGNPGKRYVNTRHNVGFRCVDCLARQQGIALDSRRSRSRLGTGEVDGTKVVLAKPATFMNLSGQAVAPLMRRYSVSAENIVLIYDDMDLPLGKVRIRERGGSGGHKGMRSVIASLGGQVFARVRVGIGPVDPVTRVSADRPEAIEYVLTDFTSGEKKVMADVYPLVADAVRCIVTEGIAAAMNKFN